MLMLSQSVAAQTSLPACTASIADTDGDSINDNDGVGGRLDIDKDGDGLIEICDLEGINEIRYQLDGSGYTTSTDAVKITQGCPHSGCVGYELVKSLDFNTTASYRTISNKDAWTNPSAAGWQPIADFEAVFNGNGHIISNLQINRVSEPRVGLFAVLGADGRIENVELLYPNIRGHSDVGSLVGINRGVVINSFVRDYDTAANSTDTTKYIEALEGSVGGLVGRNDGGDNNKGAISNSGAVVTVQIKDSATAKEATAGGLVGLSAGDIRNSYARGNVKGPCAVGGLTAQLEENNKIVNSYASVTVTTGFGACATAANIQSGSLVATSNGLIEDSYATGCWAPGTSGTVNDRRGGLIFTNIVRINNSYYQDCAGLLEVSSGSVKTQMELQSPTTATAASGIYQAWSNTDWDFGSNSQYPAIRYSVGFDKDNPGCGYRDLPDCGALIKNQLPTGRVATDSVSSVATLNFVPGNILTTISQQEDIGIFALQPPLFDFADNTYKLYVQDVRTDPTDTSDTMQFNLMLGSNYQFSNCNTNITTLSSGMGNLSCVSSSAEILFNLPHTITFNITDTSTNPSTTYGLFSIEIIPIPRPNIFTPNNILEEIIAVDNIGSFALEPPAFDANITNYQLHVQDTRTSADQQMHIRLMLSSSYDFDNSEGNTCVTNINSLSGGQGSINCPPKELNSEFNREHTVSFMLDDMSNKEYGIQIIPDILFSSVIVNSEVNGEPATFVGDGEVMRVNEGDTVSVDAMDGFVLREGVNQPLDYYWYSHSDPILFSGVRHGMATSFTIDNTIFSDSSADAVLILELRDKYNPTAIPVIKEIPIRLFGRLSLSSDVGEVIRDQVASTLHRIVLPHDQPQAVITARSLHDNITLTVDDSDTKVTAVNGSGTSTASMITVQVDDGGKTEFTIAETVADDAIVLHQVQVFRRSTVALGAIQFANVTVDASISVPGTYSAILAEGMSDVTLTEFSLTVTDINASAVTMMTVDLDGSGGNPAQSVIEPNERYYDPDVVANIATESFDLMVGSVIEITLRMRDEYVVATRASPTLEDLPYREGVYTIEIVSRPVTILDDDINGLIDIDTLEDLDDIRDHYANMPRSCGIDAIQQCRGFELRRSLDFNVDASYSSPANKLVWARGAGWQPIGLGTNGFNSRFEGNGHTISGLLMNRSDSVLGLFSILDATGEIMNVGLLNVGIGGDSDIGGLVGHNHGTIINSYVSTATVAGNMDVGGLVGRNDGSIISSFAVAEVRGDRRIGGLVGNNHGHIANAYAAGTVSGNHATLDLPLGGLAGRNDGAITNSYTISRVQPQIADAVQAGGLIGMTTATAVVTASYWDRTVNASLLRSANARTTVELQIPTMPGASSTDTYYGWHSSDWDFGDNVDYPTLRYVTAASINACASDTTITSVMTRCGSLLPDQNIRSLSSAFGLSEIMISSRPAVNSDGTINEGSVVNLMVDVFDDKEYSYQWSQTSGKALVLTTTNTATLQVMIPTDFIATDATVADITLEVTVNDGATAIRRSALITINKIDNGNPVLATEISLARLRVISQPDGDGEGVFSYQWQQLEFGGEWTNVTDATTATYWLPAGINNVIYYRVNIKHTDGQGYTTNYQQGAFRMGNIDDDGDGLIDIYYLEDLDAMRYQLDGSGYKVDMQASVNSQGCPDQVCSGYELRRDLDFNAAASYNSTSNKVAWITGTGWQPVGSLSHPFNSVFEGNGHTIANIQISRVSHNYIGLYAVVGADGKIINVQLLDVDVKGRSRVGAFAGFNRGAIINSYVAGEVSGNQDIGGMSGQNHGTIINNYVVVAVTGSYDIGGLVGQNNRNGLITNSYTTGTVTVISRGGGLVGNNFGSIIDSYATSTITGGSNSGGLVGEHWGQITNSYATGTVTGGNNSGGLVGRNRGGDSAIASYWDTDTSDINSSAAGAAKTMIELQSPTDATGIYSDWSSRSWEFGGSKDYPILRYVSGDNLDTCANDAADIVISLALPICGSVLPEQGVRASNKGLAEVFFFAGGHATPTELTPSFSQFIYSYDMTVVAADLNIQLRPYAANENAEIAIIQGTTDYFSGRASGALSGAIGLTANETTVTIVVTDIIGEDLINTTYTYVIVRLLPIQVDPSLARLTLIFDPATPDPDGAGSFSYQWQQQKPGSSWRNIVAATTSTYWLPADADGSILYRIVNIKHTDGKGNITHYPPQGPFRASIDDDGDGLIDIYTVDDLDAIRYQLDGRSYRNESTKLIVQDCPHQVCNGYELRKDLDFAADTDYRTTSTKIIWTTGSGWVPIGDSNNRFSSVLEGNGYTLSGLYIESEGLPIGLFSEVDTNSEIKNIGLLDIKISGSDGVGALIGWNDGAIINSYAIGTVVGVSSVGGLVGYTGTEAKVISSFADVSVMAANGLAGGLVGENDGSIINSYAVGKVNSESTSAGGLVGENDGSIINSYAKGNVTALGNWSGGLAGASFGSIKNTYARGAVLGTDRVGGLVGFNGIGSSIAYSYATGTVDGNNNVGGLVGADSGDITTSYWDTDTSDINSSAGGSSQTTVELQSPTGASTAETEVYYGWSESDWDFGSSNRYPALRYVSSDGLNACRASDAILSLLPACGTLLSQQRRGLDRILLLANDEDVTELLTPSFSPSIFRYQTTLTTIATPAQLALKPLATHANATIKITQQGDTTIDYFAGKANDTLSDPIISSYSTTLTIVVTDTLYGDVTTDTIYTLVIAIPFTVADFTTSLGADANADGTIDEGSTATITFTVSGGSGNYHYQYKLIDGAGERELSQLPPPVGLSMPADLVVAESTSQTVELNIIVGDDDGHSFEHSEEITVRKVDNGVATVEVIRVTNRILTVQVGADPDGDALSPSYEYRWQTRSFAAATQWTDIVGATVDSYMITDDLAVIGNEFRVHVIYTDGQGYRRDGGVYSNVVQYILLPMCADEIVDSDGDDIVGLVDIDKDGDGLIELCDLEGINEMRYQLDGSGYKAGESAAAIMLGCPLVAGEAQCRGYELARDLDFKDTTSYRNSTTSSEWTQGNGWLPIATNFAGVFEGNGYSISNLYINRTEEVSGSDQGLFSTLAATAQINNIRLVDVNIQGLAQVATLSGSNSGIISNSSVTGVVMANADVGGLVGINDGQIISSFADVAVAATINGGGGLMGRNQGSVSASHATGRVMGAASLGGISGLNSGSIISSYATGSVTGSDNIGGLVGSHQGSIINSYATGDVEGTNNIGGLVGLNNGAGRITNTYATGAVMGGSQVGGLVGRHHGTVMNSYASIGAVIGNETSSNIGGLVGIMSSTATISASYWDSETSGQESSAGGRAQMTAELQSPVAPGTTTTEVYYRWSSNDWDFGNSNHYPALRYAADDDLNDCVTNITTSSVVLPCTLLLPNQRGRNKGLATVFFFTDGDVAQVMSTPPFTPLTENYDMTVLIASTHTQLTLRPYAINDNTTITISIPGDNRDYFADKSNGELSEEILLGDEIILTVVVTDTIAGDSVNTTYTFTIARARLPLVISDLVITPSATIAEGSEATIGYTVSGGSGVYEYAYKIEEGAFTPSSPSFIYRAPVGLVATDATTQTVSITIRVSDQDPIVETIFHREEIMVRKIDNGGSFNIRSEMDASQLHIVVEGSDPDGDGSFSYQWQQRGLEGIWEDIAGATTASYAPPDSNGSVRYRAKITHTDGQGYDIDYRPQGPFRVGLIDDDGDGLIDIYYLEDLNAIRYQLDGSSYQMNLNTTTSTAGCPLAGCRGYELRRDLDFAADVSYSAIANKAMWAADVAIKENATNLGWLPIGDSNNRFRGVFEGNGFTILGLYTKTGDDKGLFSALDHGGEIKHVGLLDAYVEGDAQVGTLVGNNYGKITNSYAAISTATASGAGSSPVGGLVGFNQAGGQIISSFANVVVMASSHIAGGLVGGNNGLIINSYATGNVSGTNDIGGLVGRQDSGAVMNSYATGDINGQLDIGGLIGYASGDITNTYARGAVTGEQRVGGLVGFNNSNITNSYALGQVSGSGSAGGLFGLDSGSITASYWDRTVNSNLTMSANAKTTVELQTPTAPGLIATDVYYGWSRNDWDFGDNQHYPALRHGRGPANLNACNTDITLPSAVLPSSVLPCSIPLPNQSGRDKGLASVFVLADDADLTEDLILLFSPLRFSYDMTIVSAATHVEFSLRPYAINDNATITITDPTAENYFSGKSNGELSATIELSDPTTLTLVVTDTLDEATINTTYTFVISRVPPLVVSGITISSDTIDEGSTATLSFEVSGGTDVYRYAYKLIAGAGETLLAQSAPPVELTIPTDILTTEDDQQAVVLQISVSDDRGQFVEHSEALTIRKVDNGEAEIAISRETSRTLIVTVGSDPDGNAADPDYQWQLRTSDAEWMNIESATSASYTITDDLAMEGNEFRIRVTYVDGQGYDTILTSNGLAAIPLEISAVTISSQPAANVDGTINEGSTATITFVVRGGSGRYTYDYILAEQPLPSSSTPSLIYNVPTDLIAADDTEQTIELHITVNDAEGQPLEHIENLTIKKVNNGSADIAVNRETTTTLIVMVGSDPDGDPNPAGYTYQWQSRALEAEGWTDISATDKSYAISDDLARVSGEFRIQVMYTDRQGYKETLISNVIEYIAPSQGIKVRTKVFLEGPLR